MPSSAVVSVRIRAESANRDDEHVIEIPVKDSETANRFVREVKVHIEKERLLHLGEIPEIPPVLLARQLLARDILDPRADNLNCASAVWLELGSLLQQIPHLLAKARAYKGSETAEADEHTRRVAHIEKMWAFDAAVERLVKIKDLVARLLYEHFDGNFVAHERDILLKPILKSLRTKLPQAEFEVLDNLLRQDPAQKGPIEIYRNRLMHHVRPSVDYPEFYVMIPPRSTEGLDDAGNRIRDSIFCGALPAKPEFEFASLFVAACQFLTDRIQKLERVVELGY